MDERDDYADPEPEGSWTASARRWAFGIGAVIAILILVLLLAAAWRMALSWAG